MKTNGFKQNTVFRLLCVAAAVLIVAGSLLFVPPQGLSSQSWCMLAIVIAAMILFISEAIPITAVCFAVIVAIKYTGVATFQEIVSNSGSSAVFFCMSSFGISAALQNTNLTPILMRKLYKLSNGDSARLTSVICCLSALISIFVNNGVAQIVMISIIVNVLKCCGDPEPGTSRMAGGFMMAIFVGATAGGMFLPCSNGPNVVIMELSEIISGTPMRFFQWGMYGIPCGLALTAFAAWLLPRYFKPEPISPEHRKLIEDSFDQAPHRLESKDIKYLSIMCGMIALWVAGNWIKALDVATVAMAGVAAMMLPGIDLITTKDFKKSFSAMNIVIMLCIFPMAMGMKATGAGEWIADLIFADAAGWAKGKVIVLSVVAAFLVNLLIPSGSANAALSASVIGPLLVGAGLPVAAAMVMIGVQAGTDFLFPLEGTWQYTFGTGHYSFSDCAKCNWPIALLGILCSALLIPALTWVYGFLGAL